MTRSANAPEWMKDAIFYEIFPDRFSRAAASEPSPAPWGSAPDRKRRMGGHLDGIAARLPHLASLGVDAVYLTPIFAASTNHRYDTEDYLAVDPALGGDDALRRLTRRAHELGIRVILDGVFNHCGSGFAPFRDVAEIGASSRYRDWFDIEAESATATPLGYATCGGADYLPKLNTANPELREFLLHVMGKWILEADIDGWRMDVPWKVPRDFWEEAARRIRSAKPDACIIGEFWRESADWTAEGPFDSVMNYRWRSHVLDFCAFGAMDAEDFQYEIGRLRTAYGDAAGRQYNLLGSHDTPRILTLCGLDERRLALAMLLQFTDVGMPAIYYGDEVGMKGGNDPECRSAMDWSEESWNRQLLESTRKLAAMRRRCDCLRRGGYAAIKAFNRTLAFARVSERDAAVVIVNAGPETCPLRFDLPPGIAEDGEWVDQLSGLRAGSRGGALSLPPIPALAGYCFYRCR